MSNDGRTADDTYRSMNPFASGKEAFDNYKNALDDFEIKLIQRGLVDIKNEKETGKPGKAAARMFY